MALQCLSLQLVKTSLRLIAEVLGLGRIAVKFRREQLRHKEWVISEVHDIKQLSLNSTSRLTERTILVILFFTFSADIAPKQSELLLEETSETRSVRFISFISVECELETYTIVSVEFDHVVCLDEW
jgi:hypothetical protein